MIKPTQLITLAHDSLKEWDHFNETSLLYLSLLFQTLKIKHIIEYFYNLIIKCCVLPSLHFQLQNSSFRTIQLKYLSFTFNCRKLQGKGFLTALNKTFSILNYSNSNEFVSCSKKLFLGALKMSETSSTHIIYIVESLHCTIFLFSFRLEIAANTRSGGFAAL